MLGYLWAEVGWQEGERRKDRKRRRKGRKRRKGKEEGEEGGHPSEGSECHSALSQQGGSPHGSLPAGPCRSLKEVVILGGSMIGSLKSRKLSGD